MHNHAMANTMPQSRKGAVSGEPQIAAVAFCADKNMEVPLHVAASSLLRHLHPGYVARIYLLLIDFSERDIDQLRSTLDLTGRPYSVHLLEPMEIKAFAEYPGLRGSRTTYYRLALPDLVQEDRLLYLDADIHVKTDISPLFEEDMGCKPAGFVLEGTVRFALDHAFQTLVGRTMDAPVFNAGVCLFNLSEWRSQNCKQRLMELGAKHRKDLISHDQSMLNALFADDCYRLDPKYNVQVFPGSPMNRIPAAGILHFVGSPKPWDIGGRFFMPYAESWYRALRDTALPVVKRTNWLSANSWMRVPKIAGGYRLAARSRLRSR